MEFLLTDKVMLVIYAWVFILSGGAFIYPHLQEWRAKRKQARIQKKYENGFGWVMVDYYVNERTILDMEGYIYGNNHPFDKGARAALAILARLEMKEN